MDFLVMFSFGGWTTPFEEYDRQNRAISPTRGENKQ